MSSRRLSLRRGLSLVLLSALLSLLFIAGCGRGKSYNDQGGQNVLSAADCLGCHGTRLPTDPPADIKADIIDTHFDNWRFLPNGNFVTNSTGPIEGYVLDNTISWAPDGMGYVTKASALACSASCHDYHDTNMTINRQWALSGHAQINSPAYTHVFTTGVCMRCHSGIGYATYVDSSNKAYPGFVPPTADIEPHHLTCNGCHDGQGIPTASNMRLRMTGDLILTSGSQATSVVDATLSLGNSAGCVACHQGRESGFSLYKAMRAAGVDPYNATDETMTGMSFKNPHYLPAGSVLFGLKGYEFSGKTYSQGINTHKGLLCTGCHMASPPGGTQSATAIGSTSAAAASSGTSYLGGHTFNVRHKTASSDDMNMSLCSRCHHGFSDFESIRLYDRDMDGDGAAESIKDELDGLKAAVEGALNSQGIYFGPHSYPYFFRVPAPQIPPNGTKTWKESQLEAAFNLQYIDKEIGAYAHNYKYAAQLLRDSYEALTGSALPGLRPSSSDDRPATAYTYP